MIACIFQGKGKGGLHLAEVSNKATHSMQNRNNKQSLFVMVCAGISYSQIFLKRL